MSVLFDVADSGLELARYAHNRRGLHWRQSLDGAPPVDVDLTGWTGALTLTSQAGEVWLTVPLTCEATGLASCVITPAHLAAAVWDGRITGRWRIDLTDPAGVIHRRAQGNLAIAP